MSRLARFEHYRFIGARDSMLVYDCDDEEQFATIGERVDSDRLIDRNLLQAFAPDSELEARNRGFKPVGGTGD
jgi:hypothetical protein